jgi:predicted HTH transcriptional regulator
MRIFKDMGLCEQLGSGMKRIMEKYKQEDFEISENFVTACFKFNEHALKILNGKTEDRKSVADMNEMEFKVYAAICESSATTRGELAVATGVSESSVKSAVTSLIKKGFIERVGSDKTGKWIRKS